MRDQECVDFLQWCLPRLGLRWAGYRKVRRTVCKRLRRRLRELGFEDLDAYRARLEVDPDEWSRLDAMCRIPISRFYRDRGVFDTLRAEILPVLAQTAHVRGDHVVRCWSAGCASGEEVYSLKVAWMHRHGPARPGVDISIIGTDADETMLRRATTACYGRGSLKDFPTDLVVPAFDQNGDLLCVRPELREGIRFQRQDIRDDWPRGPFDLVLCRNLVFTYFTPPLQAHVFNELDRRLRDGGFLVIGSHETLPRGTTGYAPVAGHLPIYRRRPPAKGKACPRSTEEG